MNFNSVLKGLSRQEEERQRLTEQQQQLIAAFNKVEGGSAQDLQQLNKTQEELRAVAIRIESMASTVLVESADQTISIEGSHLKEGESCDQAGVFRIDVGEHVRLKISPGEGTGLASLEHTQKSLQIALKSWIKTVERKLARGGSTTQRTTQPSPPTTRTLKSPTHTTRPSSRPKSCQTSGSCASSWRHSIKAFHPEI